VASKKFQLEDDFPFDVWELAFGEGNAVLLNEIYLLPCTTAQNSSI
jgi:hypothetical protein